MYEIAQPSWHTSQTFRTRHRYNSNKKITEFFSERKSNGVTNKKNATVKQL